MPGPSGLLVADQTAIDHAEILRSFLDRADPLVDLALLTSGALSADGVQLIYDRSFTRGHALDYRVRCQLSLDSDLRPEQRRALWLDDDVRVRAFALTSGHAPDDVIRALVEDPAITVDLLERLNPEWSPGMMTYRQLSDEVREHRHQPLGNHLLMVPGMPVCAPRHVRAQHPRPEPQPRTARVGRRLEVFRWDEWTSRPSRAAMSACGRK